MNNKLKNLLAVVMLSLSSITFAAQGIIEVGDVVANPGDTVFVPVVFTNATNPDPTLVGFQFDIEALNANLTLTSAANGSGATDNDGCLEGLPLPHKNFSTCTLQGDQNYRILVFDFLNGNLPAGPLDLVTLEVQVSNAAQPGDVYPVVIDANEIIDCSDANAVNQGCSILDGSVTIQQGQVPVPDVDPSGGNINFPNGQLNDVVNVNLAISNVGEQGSLLDLTQCTINNNAFNLTSGPEYLDIPVNGNASLLMNCTIGAVVQAGILTCVTNDPDENPISFNLNCPQEQVIPPTVAVPTLSQWGIIIFTMMVGLVGLVAVRYRS